MQPKTLGFFLVGCALFDIVGLSYAAIDYHLRQDAERIDACVVTIDNGESITENAELPLPPVPPRKQPVGWGW